MSVNIFLFFVQFIYATVNKPYYLSPDPLLGKPI